MKRLQPKKKLRSQKGITLVEMLAAIMILSLLGMMIGTGIQMAFRSNRTLTAEAETQLLLSTVTDTIADELRFARDVHVGEETEPGAEAYQRLLDYTSASYGGKISLVVHAEDGQIYASNGLDADRRVIATGAYGDGAYSVETLDIFYYAAEGMFHVTLKVADKSNHAAEAQFSIRCLNQ